MKTNVLGRVKNLRLASSNPVALGNSLQITSVSGLVEIALSLQPEFDQTAGLIRITVEASTNAPDDKRRIATSIAFAGNQHGEVPGSGVRAG